MACRLVALDKRPGVRPVGIGETLHQVLAKLVMRAAGEQVKTVCGNLQLCAGLEAGIDGAYPSPFIQRNYAASHQCAISGPAEGGVGHPVIQAGNNDP